MTHDELLAKINYDIEGNPYDEYMSALRAVVELHKPYDLADYVKPLHNVPSKLVCVHCGTRGTISPYPCLTVQAIEKELK